MILDAFTHVLPERVYRRLRDRYGFEGLTGSPSFLWDVDRRLADMDEFGINKQVVTIAPPSIWRNKDTDAVSELTAFANDELRSFVDRHPDRFIAVGTIPMVGEGFMAEFDRCIDDLDMAGIQIFSNIDGEPLDTPRFRPLFERAERHDVPLWLHPQTHEWYPWMGDSMDGRLFGWPFDTTLALSRLVFGGVMEDHPDLDIVTHHLGGMVSFYGGRIDSFYASRKQYPENYAATDLPDLDGPASRSFQAFYADTVVSGSVPALECGESFFGADRLVFATDYPFGPDRGRGWTESGLAAVEEMDVSAEARRRILGANLAELLE